MPIKNFSEKIAGNIRKNIKEYIKIHGINQFEFSKKCGLSPATISKILNQTRELNFGTTELFAKAMEIKPEEIILEDIFSLGGEINITNLKINQIEKKIVLLEKKLEEHCLLCCHNDNKSKDAA